MRRSILDANYSVASIRQRTYVKNQNQFSCPYSYMPHGFEILLRFYENLKISIKISKSISTCSIQMIAMCTYFRSNYNYVHIRTMITTQVLRREAYYRYFCDQNPTANTLHVVSWRQRTTVPISNRKTSDFSRLPTAMAHHIFDFSRNHSRLRWMCRHRQFAHFRALRSLLIIRLPFLSHYLRTATAFDGHCLLLDAIWNMIGVRGAKSPILLQWISYPK